ncbi:MAG: glycosyltransferase [Patescibacteria group bacterium]
MTKVLSISSDRKIFEEGSAVRARMVEYAGLFEELHIVVFSTRRTDHGTQTTEHKIQIAPNCTIYRTNSWNRWFYIFDAIWIGKRIIRNSKFLIPNSVITGQDPFETGYVAMKIATRFKLPLHIQIHTDFLNPYFKRASFLNRVRVLIARRVLPKANAIRVVSQRIFNSLKELRIRNFELRTKILPIFTDVEKLRSAEPSFSLQQKYSHFGFIILVVARLTYEKNVQFALRILKKLVKKYPTTGLVIVGDGPLKRSLQLQANSLQLSKNVVFEGWQHDTISYYKTANLYLQTSLYEGFGLALFEAVASGCPAVSSDVGIAPELLNHKGHSFDCPVNDLNCFVSTISQLIEDNQLRTFYALQIAPHAVDELAKTKEQYLHEYKNSIEGAYQSN